MENQANRPQTASGAETLIACETETWSLISTEGLAGICTLSADEFCDIFSDSKERTKPELLEFLSRAELKAYHFRNFRVTMLNEDAAVVTYRADARASIQGKEVALRESVTAGWARRGEKWLNVFAVGTPPTQTHQIDR
jgi:hypothetical protein